MGLLDFLRPARPPSPIVGVGFDSTGGLLAWADRDGQLQVQEGTRRRPRRLSAPCPPLTGIWFDSVTRLLLAGCQGGRVAAFDPANGKLVGEVACAEQSSRRILSGTSRPVLDWVVAILCPPSGPTFRVLLEAGEVVSVDRERLEVVEATEPFGNLADCAVVRADGSEAFLGDDLGYLYRIGAQDTSRRIMARHSERLKAFDSAGRPGMVDHAAGIAAVAVASQRQLVASSSREGGIQLWDLETLEDEGNVEKRSPCKAREPLGATWIRGLDFAAGDAALVWGDDTGRVERWDLSSGTSRTLARLDEGVRCLAVAPGGAEVAVGGENGALTRLALGS